ncbi:methionyl-tRNA formyltransferase [Paenibacillus swuensis]|uniref:Methionyl-tRNA formyltransferase n=1 Tax=Paenibacillus swuensis TaxID=1178515 RepID=A0A172TKD1_9BACL|nr:methionyl-tRNA formyltransferase [Paenibacillus swuensis]ANE47480.1 methionyl-tRNA formyltransferase [Paenibacillus swuensis]
MRIVFMGTPEFAVPSLRALLDEGYNVVGVVTQPDRPKGRKRVLTPPPVKEEALKHGLPVLQPLKMRDPAAAEELALLEPDLVVTAAYGQILPKAVLELPRLGCINVHGSLLPKYRGGAPIQHAVMNGETVTGVTVMYMAAGLDTGDMISRVEVPIEEADTSGTMFDKLAVAGANLLLRTLPEIQAGTITAIPQNHEEATYSPNISRENELIRWDRGSRDIFNQVRGLNPWPVAYTLWNGEVFKIWSCRPGTVMRKPGAETVLPGTVLGLSDAGIEVATADGSVLLTEVQPAGKKAMDAGVFSRGSKLAPGTVLG